MNKFKFFIIAAVIVVAVSLSSSAQNSTILASNIGFIDEGIVLKNYPDAQKMQEKQKNLTLELQKFATDAKYKIASAKNEKERKNLETKLTKELQSKKKSFDAEYQKIFNSVQKNVFDSIKTTAESKGLIIVLRRNSVIYGGTNITQDVIKHLKK